MFKPSQNLIKETINTFSPICGYEITQTEAEEIASNCLTFLETIGRESQKCGEFNEKELSSPTPFLSNN
jgi:hypothetical protein